MSEKLRTPAIILSKTPYQERDLVLGLLTRNEGLVSVMARSARASRRRFSGVLDLFVVFEAEFSSCRGSLPALSAAEAVKVFPGIFDNLDRLEAGQMIIQVVREILRDAPAPAAVFDMIELSFSYLDESIPEFAYLIFLELVLWFAGDLGHVPVNGSCPGCGRPVVEAGQVHDGRVLCGPCCAVAGCGLQIAGDYPTAYLKHRFLAVNPATGSCAVAVAAGVLPDRPHAIELASAIVTGITGGTGVFSGYDSCNGHRQAEPDNQK